jgi:hypothetical protein
VPDALADLDDPWAPDPRGASGMLRTWVNGLSAEATYQRDMAPHLRSTTAATVSFAALEIQEIHFVRAQMAQWSGEIPDPGPKVDRALWISGRCWTLKVVAPASPVALYQGREMSEEPKQRVG